MDATEEALKRPSGWRTMLVLGRISNLPTVWSNCLAAWLLSGASAWGRFSLVCVGATLLYVGGMFLNDACDVEFDRQFRPERPIIAGRIGVRTVWVLAATWLLAGWLIFLPHGKLPMLWASILVATIVTYDLVHKRTILAPWLMAACRFLLYVLSSVAAAHSAGNGVLWRASALALYIVGLSFLARGESSRAVVPRLPGIFLFAPILVAVLDSNETGAKLWIRVIIQGIWVSWCLSGISGGAAPSSSGKRDELHVGETDSDERSGADSGSGKNRGTGLIRRYVPSGAAGLLAGIVLVDCLAANSAGAVNVVFAGLFILALLLQRIAPAT